MNLFSPPSDKQHSNRAVMEQPRGRRLGFFALVCVIYFTVSGGAFGIEPLVGAVGPGMAVLLIVVTPIFWSLPMALMVAELATLLPEEGGYYVWVRESLGDFWAVQEAWWTMGYSIALVAMLSLLFGTYLDFFIRLAVPTHDSTYIAFGPLSRWLLASTVIGTATIVNLLGARDVGRSSKVGATLVVGAFAAMCLFWILGDPHPWQAIRIVRQDLSGSPTNALLVGLSIIVFNYGGWDNASTYAGEVDHPQRNYPRAIAVVFVVVLLGYLLPVIVGIGAVTDRALWTTDAGWPVIAELIGGRRLGSLIAGAGLVSVWALVNAQLFYVSRMPLVLARDGWLAAGLAKVSADSAAPTVAVVSCALVAAGLAAFPFGGLAVIQCLLYIPALVLELLSLIVMRRRRPHADRPFRVPGGWWGLAYVCLAPCTFGGVVLFATLRDWRAVPQQMLVVGLIAISGVLLYFARRGLAMKLRLDSGRFLPPRIAVSPAEGEEVGS